MESKKILGFSVIALFLLNLGTLCMLWIGHGHPHGPPPPPGGGPAQFLIHELNFTADQTKKFEALKEEHHSRMNQIQDSLRTLHDLFFIRLSDPEKNYSDSTAHIIGEKQSEMERLTFDHFKKVRAICTPEQQKKFDTIIMEALRMMGPHPPPPPPPPDR